MQGTRLDSLMKDIYPRQVDGPVARDLQGDALPVSRVITPSVQKQPDHLRGTLLVLPTKTWESMSNNTKRTLLRSHCIHLRGGEDGLLPGVDRMDSAKVRSLIPFHVLRQGNCKCCVSRNRVID